MYNPRKLEKDVLKFWKKNKIFEKLMKKISKSKKRFSFIDGPITANNPMGVHHAWGRTYKDLFLRFKAMQGFNQRRQNGFDCQGLWVEREVEKEMGFKTKDDIEKFGVLNFVKACRARVEKFSKKMIETSIRLGQWMDWPNTYYTMTDKSNEYKWWFLKECFRKGWLYKGKDSVPWCPRCTSASSKHDIATEGYKEVEHDALFMKFPIKGKKNEFILIFTTTPWTIPANVVSAVKKDLIYVKVKQKDEHYWIAESRIEELKGKYEIIEKLKGEKLVGLKYEMPYSKLPAQKGCPHKIVEWELASGEEGTGIVHIAPGCGPEDYDLGKKLDLPKPSPLNDVGKYIEGYDWLTGNKAKDMNPKILEDMKERGFVYKIEKIRHRYPHCWRCGEELVFRLVDEWYISVDGIRSKLIKENRKIKWVPEYGQKSEEDWLNNMGDWLFSRKRYWGLPLPFWVCSCGHVEVIGSKKELEEKAVEGFEQLEELHRPWIDKVKIKCPKCNKIVSRIIDTGDVWLDAGMVPFFTLDYLSNKKYFEEWYPADFVTECGPGQYRCWFYSMILHGVILTGKRPFNSVMTNDLVKDETGKEMHKSWGNAVNAMEALEKVGADPMRWNYCLHDPSRELWFGFKSINEDAAMLNILYNTVKYLETYLTDGFKPVKLKKIDKASKWLLSRLETLKINTTKHLEDLHPHLATNGIKDFFINDLSRWYGQIIRDELKSNSGNKKMILTVFYEALKETLKLLAPIIPFLTEELYQNLFRKYENIESIHLCDWPKPDKKIIDKKIENNMEIIKKIVESSHALRLENKIKLKYVLPALIVSGDKEVKKAVDELKDVLLKMANVKKVKFAKLKEGEVEIKLNYKVAGKKFGKDVKKIAKLLEKVKEVKDKTKVGKFELNKEDLIVRESGGEGKSFGIGRVNLDLNISKKIKEEWLVRELIRAVQSKRKELGLKVKDKVKLYLDKKFSKHKKIIEEATNSKIEFKEGGDMGSVEFEEKKFMFGVEK